MTDDELLFAPEAPEVEALPVADVAPWRVLIIDDDPEVHQVTRIALRGLRPFGRPLEFLSAHSAAEGEAMVRATPDLALILLDVVMETDDAGLQLARRIREEIGNRLVRIVLRTGQAGQAPERSVVAAYDINDYRAKVELTSQRLATTVLVALRGYEQVCGMERGRRGLQQVLDATAALFGERCPDRFASGAVRQFRNLLGGDWDVLLCMAALGEEAGEGAEPAGPVEPRLLASTDERIPPGLLAAAVGPEQRRRILSCLAAGEHGSGEGWMTLHVRVSRGVVGVLHAEHAGDAPSPMADGSGLEAERKLLELFLRMIAVGLDNVLLFDELVKDRTHDRATGLLNRSGFVAAIDAQLARMAAGAIDACSVATIDLRRFRDINHELGVSWGDRLLAATAERLAAAAGGPGLCARIGGDQFAVLLPGLPIELARGRLREIATALGAPIMLAGREVHPLAIPGLAWCGKAGLHAEELLARAEDAMQQAKRTFGRLTEVVVGEAEAPGRLGLTIELNAALKQNQFELYYQPIVNAADRQVVALEALIRWNHPTRGTIAPAAFIPTAEETGLIVPIGSWVLREAARQAAAWHRASPRHRPWVSVNISAAQLSEPGFLEGVRAVIEECGVDPSWLKLEVTESTIISDPDHAALVLSGLRDLGIRLSMDDFGTGYSNLSYLQTLPFDFLKIDRAFVKSMIERFESRTILRTMMALAQQLEIEVVAEGVETAAQADELTRLGCGFLQGFLFGRPMPACAAGRLIGA